MIMVKAAHSCAPFLLLNLVQFLTACVRTTSGAGISRHYMRALKQSRAPLALDGIERGPGLIIPAPFTPWEWDWARIRAQRAIAAPG
jgi:hypothetical protein